MGYLGKCFHRAFAGSVLFTDKVSIVGGVLAPAIFFARGEAMDAAYQGYLAWTILAVVGGGIALRLVTAPYFIWRDDQKEISRLREEIADTSRKRRQFFEETFLQDRADLARQLTHYAMVNAPIDAFSNFDADAHLNEITRKAVIQLGDPNFRVYWETFCFAFRNLVRGAKFAKDNAARLTDEQMQILRDRFDYDFGAMKAGSTALIFILTENHDHNKVYVEILEGLNTKYPHVQFDDVAASLWTLPGLQSLPDADEKRTL